MTVCWTLTWEAGPDAGGSVVLGDGAHFVGRARGAEVRCDDPALEPHHLLVEIRPDRTVLRQLTGRVPVRVDGAPLGDSLVIVDGALVEVGHSILKLSEGDLTAPGQSLDRANITVTTHGTVVVRWPRAMVAWEPTALCPPNDPIARSDIAGSVLPAMLALAGSALVAVLVRQPMFLIFGALGAIVAFGTWGGQRVGLFRRRRRDEVVRRDASAAFQRAVDLQRDAYVAHHLATAPTPASARRTIEGRTSDLWSRRAAHPDGFAVSIGLGTIPWHPRLVDAAPVTAETGNLAAVSQLADLPVVAHVDAACQLAIRGEPARARSVVRSIVMQLAANCGPADVRFVIVTDEPARWRWLQGLPHATTAAGVVAVVTEDALLDTVAEYDLAPQAHLVVITDDAELLAARTSPLRRLVVAEHSAALIVLVGEGGGVPHVCTSLLDVCATMMARWHPDAAVASLPEQVRCFGISEHSAASLVASLSDLIDPEDPLGGAVGIPREVTLLSLLPSPEPAAIAASWVAGGIDPRPRTVIGMAADGVVDIDLERDGPHALIAGTTGAGKSELLRSLVVGLAVASSPDHLTFVLIDYKGGSTFDACAGLAHVVGVVTDLDDHLANRVLRCLTAELRRREHLLRSVGAADLATYRRLAPNEVLARLVVVVDEFAALVSEQPAFLHALVGIAQRGRSLGVHLILATQRPSGVISDDIRANTNLRLALRLHDSADAIDVVGDRAPAAIPRGLPGRAVMRLGPDEVLTFQTAQCTIASTAAGTQLDALVAAVHGANVLVGTRPPRSPWPPPLPALLPVDEAAIADGVVGLVDDPDGQRMVPLRWSRADGHLLLVGAAGSGVTSTLALLGTAAAVDGSGCHLYVIDGHGDHALTMFEHSPWCGGVVRLHEQERLSRLVSRVAGELARRIAHPTAPRFPIVVLVDGFDAVRAALDDLETVSDPHPLDTIVADGAAHDVIVVCAFDRVGAIPPNVLARCGRRWVFHLTDPVDAAGLGVATAAVVPAAQPGRLVVAATGLEAQLMVGSVDLPACVDGLVPSPVECLPAALAAGALPPGSQCGDATLLPLGLRFGDGGLLQVDVPDGEHLLIIGPPRSGRSTALQRMVMAWRDAYRDGWWRVVAPRRTVLAAEHRHPTLAEIIDEVPAAGRVLIAVDDAELVDDIGGALGALAASRRPGLTIIATGKPDSLRQSYGHWTGVVRRSRLGIVTTSSNDLDGDLIGAVLPRRTPIASRPGLVWLVSDGDTTLGQVAVDHVRVPVDR